MGVMSLSGSNRVSTATASWGYRNKMNDRSVITQLSSVVYLSESDHRLAYNNEITAGFSVIFRVQSHVLTIFHWPFQGSMKNYFGKLYPWSWTSVEFRNSCRVLGEDMSFKLLQENFLAPGEACSYCPVSSCVLSTSVACSNEYYRLFFFCWRIARGLRSRKSRESVT